MGGVGGREGLFMPPFIHLLERGTLSNLFLKRKVNALTSKLKTYFWWGWRAYKCGGMGEEEEREEKKKVEEEEEDRRPMRLRRPATPADNKDIEFQLAHTCIYIQPTCRSLGKQLHTPIQTASLRHLHKLIEQIKIPLKFFIFFQFIYFFPL